MLWGDDTASWRLVIDTPGFLLFLGRGGEEEEEEEEEFGGLWHNLQGGNRLIPTHALFACFFRSRPLSIFGYCQFQDSTADTC